MNGFSMINFSNNTTLLNSDSRVASVKMNYNKTMKLYTSNSQDIVTLFSLLCRSSIHGRPSALVRRPNFAIHETTCHYKTKESRETY